MDDTNTDYKFLLAKIDHMLGVDFTEYRFSCLKRRIDSRVRLHNLDNYRQYAHLLEQSTIELDQLLKTLTIHLTEFFRDTSAWARIQKDIIPKIIEQKSIQKNKGINIWSAGASSGEEAYSLAILFHSILGEAMHQYPLTIYGTDIDKTSLQHAKEGIYLAKKMQDIPLKLKKNYFNFDGAKYQVKEHIRRLTCFKYDDLMNSEMNVSMDLIVCRNVLIYFNRELQQKVLSRFNNLLKPNGFLMLGKTESIAYQSLPDLKVINTKERIYQKQT